MKKGVGLGDIYDVRLDDRFLLYEIKPCNIARTALARIIGNPDLWQHFANTELLASFWKRAPDERQQIWGEPVDPMMALADFDPQYIHDGVPGGRGR
jgi:hypothetical protein